MSSAGTPQAPAASTSAAAPGTPKAKQPKAEKPKNEKSQKPPLPTGPPGERNLSAKELKEQKKAEKQARRAQEKVAAAGPATSNTSIKGQDGKGKQDQRGKQQQQQQQGKKGEKGKGAQSGSATGGASGAGAGLIAAIAQQESKDVALFRHLENPERQISVASAHKDVHPAVLALGLQMASFVICGSNARCIATLHAFKRVIEDYVTPPHTTLTRNLSSHHLSPQIEYLRSARPMSVSMRNAIRWLKLEISTLSIDLPEESAKRLLLSKIDAFIREKITIADQAITATAVEKIVKGDVIVTFAKSSIVEQVLVGAHRKGIKFRVVVVDSRPLLEGKQMVKALAATGIECTYTLIHALSYVIRDATKIFLGAHAMLSNGRLYSRVGTAAVAMHAKELGIPVIVCCESLKFTDKVGLDSIVNNELCSPDQLINTSIRTDNLPRLGRLVRWREVANLRILNVMYDVTPAENIAQVITEYGSLPPSSVPVVHRLSTNQ